MIYEDEEYDQERMAPAYEGALWSGWVVTVCGWQNIPTPTAEEWLRLQQNWIPGKAPVDSVAELRKMRENAEKTMAKNQNLVDWSAGGYPC